MTAVDATPMTPGTAPDPHDTAVPACPACAHPMSAHDVIAARFCAATTARESARGCVCRN
jgi:hypothetical protein